MFFLHPTISFSFHFLLLEVQYFGVHHLGICSDFYASLAIALFISHGITCLLFFFSLTFHVNFSYNVCCIDCIVFYNNVFCSAALVTFIDIENKLLLKHLFSYKVQSNKCHFLLAISLLWFCCVKQYKCSQSR